MMSFAGEEPDTRLGHRTIARLCAPIKFVDERSDTSCIKSRNTGWYCHMSLKIGRTKDVAEQDIIAPREG
jgi:hypothetical protein